MDTDSVLPEGYLRQVRMAAARRATRSVLRAIGGVMVAAGMVCVALVALGWLSTFD